MACQNLHIKYVFHLHIRHRYDRNTRYLIKDWWNTKYKFCAANTVFAIIQFRVYYYLFTLYQSK
jgi:hypothetical protein